MGVMKMEMKSVPGRTTENFGCHEDIFSEAQIENRYMSTVSCNSTSKDDDRSVLDLPSDCGKCSNVAPTESWQHKNSGNRLHRNCSRDHLQKTKANRHQLQ